MRDLVHSAPRFEILSGWKEIAYRLGRSVRTVQRYERMFGLPVHRPAGKAPAAVLASTTEIDLWISARAFPRALDVRGRNPQSYSAAIEERRRLLAQMAPLRNELRTSIHKIRQSILKLRRELNENRKRQDAISSIIARYSKITTPPTADGNHYKPN